MFPNKYLTTKVVAESFALFSIFVQVLDCLCVVHDGWLYDRQTRRILFGRGGSVTCCCVVGGGRVEGHVENRGPANVSFLFSCSSKNLLTYMLIQRY